MLEALALPFATSPTIPRPARCSSLFPPRPSHLCLLLQLIPRSKNGELPAASYGCNTSCIANGSRPLRVRAHPASSRSTAAETLAHSSIIWAAVVAATVALSEDPAPESML